MVILNQVKVYFYVRPSQVKGKRGCLYARVIVGGKMLVTSVRSLEMYPSEFDVRTQNPRKSCEMYFECSEFMLGMRREIMKIHNDFERKRRVFTKDDLKKAVKQVYYRVKHPGQDPDFLTFPAVWEAFLAEQKKDMGKLISKGTYDLRKRYLLLIRQSLMQMGVDSMPARNYETSDVERLQTQMLSSGYNKNYVGRVMHVVNMVFRWGKKAGHLDINPCEDVKRIKVDKTPNKLWLEPDELERWWALDLSDNREAERVRDAFYFCCWTGLAIGDYELLNEAKQQQKISRAKTPRAVVPGEIVQMKAGRMLIGRRQKTGTLYRVPLLEGAEAVIEKYGGLQNMPYLLRMTGPMLNTLAQMAGIRKKLRFHTARKTKANYLLNVRKLHPFYAIEIMGWKKIDEAAPYTQVSADTLASQMHGEVVTL